MYWIAPNISMMSLAGASDCKAPCRAQPLRDASRNLNFGDTDPV